MTYIPSKYPRRLALSAMAASAVAAWVGGADKARALPKPTDWKSQDLAIRTLIAQMQAAWNQGDFRGYMEGFQNPEVLFVSRGRIKTGWQDTLDHYIRDYGGAPERRGRLTFSDIQVERLAPDAAQLISHYRLDRRIDPQDGINTRLMRKRDGRWVIVLNHVSSREPAPKLC